MGVNVIEADGQRSLDKGNGRGDAGDVFGSADLKHLDGAHSEKVRAALCNISLTADSVTLDIYVSRQTCPEMVSASAVSPATAAQTGIVGGAELVIEGTLENAGTNFFNDLHLVVRGADGSEIPVTSPVAQDAATPLPDPPDQSLEGQPQSSSPSRLPDLLGKKVIVRGDLQRLIQKGTGMTETLRIKELQVLGD
ncbi:hypothetical protein [Sinorhizobium psoraleae]|uniref:DUF5666 domain-containing protein n=1 Tax=Sinorhizobium psoraleae TaxID=520838 RepID=A0ABT4KCL4_9HYPH|nr:hypothetical protein [Sinorhizobium psoraleae]MCZ4088722.1 hypothetical protein [Sinorhizobium psoraleae]